MAAMKFQLTLRQKCRKCLLQVAVMMQKQWLQLKSVRLNMIMLLILTLPLQSLFTISMLLKQADTTKTIIASTASPFKFNQSVLIALEDHNAVVGKDEFTLLKELSEKSNMQIPKSLYELKDKSVVFDLVCDKDEMQQIVSDFLMVE